MQDLPPLASALKDKEWLLVSYSISFDFIDLGTGDPTPCPQGKYNNGTGAASIDGCSPCTGGMYCPDIATTLPVYPCQAG